jgi:hypothetical protein
MTVLYTGYVPQTTECAAVLTFRRGEARILSKGTIMGQNRRQILSVVLGTIALIFYLVRWQETNRGRAVQSAPYGRFTADQILAHSEPLFHAFFPERNGLMISAERQKAGQTESGERLLWAVDCADEAGRHLAYLCWDADSGQLVFASRLEEKILPETEAMRPSAELLGVAHDWLYGLGIADNTERWRLIGTRMAPSSRLHAYWRSEHQTAVVVVDGRSGQFISATNGRQSLGRARM